MPEGGLGWVAVERVLEEWTDLRRRGPVGYVYALHVAIRSRMKEEFLATRRNVLNVESL